MNIIYLHSHDTGRYLQPYGHAVPAPNLQRLAEEGVLFRRAFSAAPTCSPSRACLLTGQSAHSCGQLGLANRDFFLQHPERHLANFLHGHGYSTALCGFQHLTLDSRTLGYDWIAEADPPGSGRPEYRTEAAVEFINRAHDRPFFLAVGYSETHRVFPEPSEEEDERYTLPPAPLPDTPETRYDMASYKRMAKILDDQVGDCSARAGRGRPGRGHAVHLHDRPRAGLPRHEMHADRSRLRRVTDRARAARL